MLGDEVEATANIQAIIVLGMHRSGTSAVTRLLNLAGGADLPHRLMDSRPDNETGFWESQPITDLDDELLEEAKSAWDDPAPTPEAWLLSEQAVPYVKRLSELLEAEFSGSSMFVVKDPRISRLLPLWIRALETLPAEPLFVITVRNPLEVADSLGVRDGFSPAKSSLLWLWHVLEAEHFTRGHKRSFVGYEELLADWRQALGRIGSNLDLRWPPITEETTTRVNEFLSDRHRHYRHGRSDIESNPHVTSWVRRTYSAIVEAAESPETHSEALDAVRNELLTANATFGPIITTLQLEAATNSKEVHRLGTELSLTNQEVAKLHKALGKVVKDNDKRDEEIAVLRDTRELLEHGLKARVEAVETSAERAEMLWSSKPWRAYLRLAGITRRFRGSGSRGDS